PSRRETSRSSSACSCWPPSPSSVPISSPTSRTRGSIRASTMSDRWLRASGGALGLGLTLALVALALLANVLAPTDPFDSVAAPLSPPSRAHTFGTDDLGRDVLAGVIHCARTSLVIAGSVTALAALLGLAVGAVAGYWAGAIDDVLMRATD